MYTKKDNKTIEVSETTPSKLETKTYNIDFLVSQRESILKDKARVAKELADVDLLISEAGKLGIVIPK
jgi:alpha-mannosidase